MLKDEKIQLINKFKKNGIIKSKEVEKAFLKIPREKFVPYEYYHNAYIDTPLKIGFNQTISAPHMVAIMAEALDIRKGQKILEIGTGSGYHVAIVSKLVGEKGYVYSIERFTKLAKKAEENIKKIKIKNIKIEIGDGSKGLKKNSPYDRIYFTCAAPGISDIIVNQLKIKGKLLIPVGKTVCNLILLEKNENEIKKYNLGGCAFVPLIGELGHKK